MKLRRNKQLGFSLVEVSLALGVAGFCLVSIMGLLPVGMTSNQNSLEQTVASSVAAQVFGDLRATPNGTNVASPRYGLIIPPINSTPTPLDATAVQNGSLSVTYTAFASADGTLTKTPVLMGNTSNSPISKFKVAVTITTPAGPSAAISSAQATMVDIVVTWPAVQTSSQNALGQFETVSALNRG